MSIKLIKLAPPKPVIPLEQMAVVASGAVPVWPDPKPIDPPVVRVKKFADHMIPPQVRQSVKTFSRNANVPTENMSVALLVMLASLVGARCGIRPKRRDPWEEVPNLWGAIFAPPGSKKSGTLKAASKSVFSRLQVQEQNDYAKRNAKHLASAEVNKARDEETLRQLKVATKDENKQEVDRLREILAAREDDAPPHCHQYAFIDATTEAMLRKLVRQPGGACIVKDELFSLVTDQKKKGREGDRPFYNEGWNGTNPYIQQRMGRPDEFCENLCLSVIGCVPAACVAEFLGGPDDGWGQRFQLMVQPDPIEFELVDEEPSRGAQEALLDLADRLASLPFTEYGAVQGDGRPYYKFSDTSDTDAQEVYLQWLTSHMINKVNNPGEPPGVRQHLSKYCGLVPKLALIFHLIEIAAGAPGGPVTLDALRMAIDWCEVLESHARRIYQQAPDPKTLAVYSLAKKISEGALEDGLTARDIAQKRWSHLTTSEQASAAANELCARDWLQAVEVAAAKGQRPTTKYAINPKTQNFLNEETTK